VAAARILGPALRSGGIVGPGLLRRVQRRRWAPTVAIQTFQRLAHRMILGPALTDPAPQDQAPANPGPMAAQPTPAGPPPQGSAPRVAAAGSAAAGSAAAGSAGQSPAGMGGGGEEASVLPAPLRLMRLFPVLQGIPARLVAIGPLPEHAPEWARPRPAAGAPRADGTVARSG